MKNKNSRVHKIVMHPFFTHCQVLFAFVFLPLINLAVLCLADPMRENISYIANALGYRFIGIVWALSCAFYLYVYTLRFAYSLAYTHRFGTWGLFASTFGMLLSVLIPYMPEVYPFIAKFHINLSMASTILYVLVMYHILLTTYYREPLIISRLLPFFSTIVGSCLLLFLLMGCVSTLLEVLFVIPMGLFLYWGNKVSTKKG